MNGTVSIIMTTRNEEENIVAAVDSLMSQDYKKIIQFIVIDDESIDNTFPMLQRLEKKYPGRLTLIERKYTGRGGVGSSYNIGLKKARGEYIVQAEADAVFEKDFISSAVKKISSDPKIAGVTPQCLFPGKGIWIDAANLLRKTRVFLGSSSHSGKFYKTKVVIEVGGFDERIYFEDNALTRELRKRGYKIVWEGERPLWWHTVSGELDSGFAFIRKAFRHGLMAVHTDIKYPKRLIGQGNIWLLSFLFLALSLLNQLFLIPAFFLLALCILWNLRYIYGASHYSKNPILIAAMVIFVVTTGISVSIGKIVGLGRLILKA